MEDAVNCGCNDKTFTYFWKWANTPRSEGSEVLNGGFEDNIDFGTVPFDIATICNIADEYYRNWFIVDPYNEFHFSLQECYDLNKEKIIRFYEHTQSLRTTAYTKMTVDYGQRKSSDKGFEYPVNGDLDSSPTTGREVTDDAKQDVTTVEKDDAPIKTVNDVERLRTFNQMFVDCFKPCFTLFECMTW